MFLKRLFSCRPPCSGSGGSFGLPDRMKFDKYNITAEMGIPQKTFNLISVSLSLYPYMCIVNMHIEIEYNLKITFGQ